LLHFKESNNEEPALRPSFASEDMEWLNALAASIQHVGTDGSLFSLICAVVVILGLIRTLIGRYEYLYIHGKRKVWWAPAHFVYRPRVKNSTQEEQDTSRVRMKEE